MENLDKSSSKTAAFELRSEYQNLTQKAKNLFPKVDESLLMDMLKLETSQKDWQGTVILEIRYPKDKVKLDYKIDKLYNKYERIPSEIDDRTLRLKALHMNTEELELLLKEDQEIEYVSGSAEHSQKDEYPSSRQ